jgi:hypothetical protein
VTDVAVVVPFRSDDPERVVLRDWCVARWAALHPAWPLLVIGDGAESGPFNRSRAVNRGVAATDAEVVIVADADIAVRHGQALEMVDVLGWASWVVGYRTMTHLTRQATIRFMSYGPETPMTQSPDGGVRWMSTESVCGLVALRRDDYLAIGGNDERFCGWGWEDTSFAYKADTLLGPHRRTPGECIHLFHTLRPDRKQDANALAHAELGARYEAAAGDPDAMTALAREASNLAAW